MGLGEEASMEGISGWPSTSGWKGVVSMLVARCVNMETYPPNCWLLQCACLWNCVEQIAQRIFVEGKYDSAVFKDKSRADNLLRQKEEKAKEKRHIPHLAGGSIL